MEHVAVIRNPRKKGENSLLRELKRSTEWTNRTECKSTIGIEDKDLLHLPGTTKQIYDACTHTPTKPDSRLFFFYTDTHRIPENCITKGSGWLYIGYSLSREREWETMNTLKPWTKMFSLNFTESIAQAQTAAHFLWNSQNGICLGTKHRNTHTLAVGLGQKQSKGFQTLVILCYCSPIFNISVKTNL